ncbi:MAG TPA: hypothetical protein VMJ10_36070 [Kofleriaceae bacterium]|nr:hypothetical protein [Kofleriaceae bacterium]
MTKLVLVVVALAACATTYATAQRELGLEERTNMELGMLRERNPSLAPILRDSFAFAVFPSVGEGQIGTGGAYGHGVLYVNGLPAGFVAMHQPASGLDLQGRTYTEVLLLRDQDHVEELKAGQLDLVDAPVVFMREGRDISTAGIPGTVALIEQRGGARLGVSVAGQQIVYEPRG